MNINETISTIIALSLPFIFHLLMLSKIQLRTILIITGSLMGISILLAIDLQATIRGIVQHRKTIINLILIGAMVYTILRRFLFRTDNEEDGKLVLSTEGGLVFERPKDD